MYHAVPFSGCALEFMPSFLRLIVKHYPSRHAATLRASINRDVCTTLVPQHLSKLTKGKEAS